MPIETHQKGPSRRPRLRRHFCFPCDHWTLRLHRHADTTFNAFITREARP